MPSSISSSSAQIQPPLRSVPDVAWRGAITLAVLLVLVGIVGWELYWRSQQFEPSYRNSAGLWAMTRRKVDRQPVGTTAVIGSSRILFDLDLYAWQDQTGNLPVQLALEGSSPRPVLTQLAQESEFGGVLLVGVTPGLFFSPGFGFREDAFKRYEEETPSQWIGQRLSMVVEPWLGFYHFDTALFTVLERQAFWPERLDPKPIPEVRRLSTMDSNRNTIMWSRVENDAEYRKLVRGIWMDFLNYPREPPPPEKLKEHLESVFEQTAKDVEAIRARGGEVVFVRCPSSGPFRDIENKAFAREKFWDELVKRSGSIGIHFEDHPALSNVEIPEWSHIRAADRTPFTLALLEILQNALDERGVQRSEPTPRRPSASLAVSQGPS